MKLIAYIAGISLVSVAVFGFLGMGHIENGHVHGGCIAALANRSTACPDVGNSFSDANFHLNTFRGFSVGLPTTGFVFLLTLTLLAGGLGLLLASGPLLPSVRWTPSPFWEPASSPAVRRALTWRALLEHSPSLA